MAERKLRIVQAMASFGPGGAESFYVRLMKALHDDDRIEVLPIVKTGSWIAQMLDAQDVPYQGIRYGGKLDIISRLQCLWLTRQFKADIVQTWLNRASGLFPRTGLPTAARLGGYYYYKHFKKCRYMIGNTEDICDYIKKGPWAPEDVFYLPNFAAMPETMPARAAMAAKFGVDPSKRFITLMGRLHDEKGFDVIIPLLAKLPEDVHMLLGGMGGKEQKLKALAAEHGLSDRVHFLGWIDHPTDVYALTDLFVIPSRHEPLGNVVLEGWAHKLPIVSSTSEGPEVLIDHEQNGLLVDIDDADGFYAAIADLLANPDKAKQLATAGHQKLCDNFSKEVVVDKYVALYRHIDKTGV